MTAAYEVWEQLGRRAPDAIVGAVGHGGLFLGFARGFRMLHDAGLIDRLPRMVAVQSEGCDPIVRGWENGDSVPPRVVPTPTVADGIIVEIPVRGKEVLRAIRETGGRALRVGNEAILQARDAMAKRGFMIEPTSAVPVVALPDVRAELGPDAVLVVPLTGNGLKMLRQQKQD
jgi:threonine synthase